ncbi:MAG TPA: GMC family oxidoreductase [Bryobacteraceae bacterium]|nr:GMC family oxidoreductase [Bryobacteraceae bacterium]
MIYDLRTFGAPQVFEADVCIVGAGAAGIAMARDFIGTPWRVLLLESGGLQREARVQKLYSATSIGEHYYQSLDSCRSRYFGGSTNCWGGICTPLDEIDFEERPWIPWSGWPTTFDEIEPCLRRAHRLCGTGPYLYDSGAWDQIGLPHRSFDPTLFRAFVWHFNSRAALDLSFGKRFRAELRGAPNIDVLLHASVTELLTNESGNAIDGARVQTLDGGIHNVRARKLVLACGGIENARILLASTRSNPAGVGNAHGNVGRFFHEHLQLPCGMLVAPEHGGEAFGYSRLYPLGGTACLPGLQLAPEAQVLHHTPNVSISIDPLYDRESALIALQKLRSDFKTRRISFETLKRLGRAAAECHHWAPEAWRRFVEGDRPRGDPRRFLVFARSEQTPNPNSRVTLSREADELGMPRAVLDWHTTPFDRTGIRLAASYAVREFRRLGIGEIIEADWLAGSDWPEDLAGGPHHMGTTRMSEDVRFGVVDRNCRVHGVNGLYVAGSSVFPTGGHANPTLSILALALRLADHVRASLSDMTMAATSATAAARLPVAREMAAAPLEHAPDLSVVNRQSAGGNAL